MNRPLTPEEVARLKAAHREMGEQELEGMKNRLADKHGALGEDERARMVERLRSIPLP